ncbi:MAG: hypothetical protein FLDDKLPJ_00832 [Phycisphaerae bacterium]|nr:hypothetical protein [Phycisphaerae bacterium]
MPDQRSIVRRSRLVFPGATLAFLAGMQAQAQILEQSVSLQPGWNAVFLEVEPEPDEISVVFAGAPVRSIWLNEPTLSMGPAADCPDEGEVGCPITTPVAWQVWYPPENPAHVIGALRTLRGGRAYLIEAADAATVTLRGIPTSARTSWRQGFNLAGFHVTRDAGAAPAFAAFLSGSPAHADASIFELKPDGSLRRVEDPTTSRIAAGRAYWVESKRNAVYDGPIRIDAASLRGIEFSGAATQHALVLENLTGGSVRAQVAPVGISSGGASSGGGTTPLVWRETQPDGTPLWRPLERLSLDLSGRDETGAGRTLRLAVRGDDLRDLGGGDGRGGVLSVSDGAGFVRYIPVGTRGDDQNGLWVGNVSVTHVRSLTTGEPNPTPTGSAFDFRVIIHRSSTGYRLLRDVVLAYQRDAQEYALVTSECPELLDAEQVSPRISSANFSFDGTIALTGDFDAALTTAAPIVVDANDAVNPFRHAYNPIHGVGWDVERTPTLTFDDDGGGDPNWGVTWLSGDYAETVLILDPSDPNGRIVLEVAGRFELRRVSNLPRLCGS